MSKNKYLFNFEVNNKKENNTEFVPNQEAIANSQIIRLIRPFLFRFNYQISKNSQIFNVYSKIGFETNIESVVF